VRGAADDVECGLWGAVVECGGVFFQADVLVLQGSGGNLYDCCAMAVRTALQHTELPEVELVLDEETGEAVDFEMSSDPHAIRKVGGMDSFPLLVTVSECGGTCIVDATEQEELCIGGRLTVAVNSIGSICAVKQDKSVRTLTQQCCVFVVVFVGNSPPG
jgi:exosome complex RNA-binding protein Rrp42 (RNase PH superfamily)